MRKLKVLAIAVVLLLGITGVALASGKVAGTVGGSDTSLTGTNGASDEETSAAGDVYGDDDDSAVENQYGDDDATEIDDDATEVEEHNGTEVESDDESDDSSNASNEVDDEDDDAVSPATSSPAGGEVHSRESDDNEHMSSGSVTGTASGDKGSSSRHSGDDD